MMPRDACKEGAPEWAIASAGVAAMKVLIFSIFISKKFLNWAGSRDVMLEWHCSKLPFWTPKNLF